MKLNLSFFILWPETLCEGELAHRYDWAEDDYALGSDVAAWGTAAGVLAVAAAFSAFAFSGSRDWNTAIIWPASI